MNHPLLIPALFELLAKSGLLLLGAAALAATMQRSSAARRHSRWLAIFVALLLLPLTKFIAPRWPLPGSPPTPAPVTLRELPTIVPAPPTDEMAPVTTLKTRAWPEPRRLLLGAWLAGAAAILGYRLLGSVQIAWLKRRSVDGISDRLAALARTAADEMNLRHPGDIRLAAAVRVPCTWGVWRPVVLLPAAAETWTDERLLAALRHEFAHIARHDYVSRWVALLACALYWPNPLVWLAARRLCTAQEQACDDLVLRAGTPPTDYAALLFETARTFTQPGASLRAAVAMARPSTLEGRVLAIVDETRDRRPAGRLSAWAGALAVAAIVSASALAQVAPEKSAPPTEQQQQQIQIDAKFFEVPAGAFPAAEGAALNPEQAAEIVRKLQAGKGADLLSTPRVLTRSGQQATIQIGRDVLLPAGSTPKTKFVGISLDATPTLEEGVIKLTVKAEIVSVAKEAAAPDKTPVFRERTTETVIKVRDGESVVLTKMPADQPGRDIYVLLMAATAPLAAPRPAAGPSPAPVSLPAASAAAEKAAKIIIPKLDFSEASLRDCVTFLQQKSRDHSPDKQGVNLVLSVPTGDEPKITLSLTNISLLDAVKYVAQLGGLDFGAQPDALVIGTPPPAVAAPAESATLAKAQKIILPKIELREATVAETLEFLRKKAVELDPEKTGVNVILKPDPASWEARLSLSLTNVPLAEALRYVASLAGMELVAEPNALLLRAPGKSGAIRSDKTPAAARTVVTAERATFDKERQTAEFRGNVEIKQGNQVITSDRAKIKILPEGAGEARGPVIEGRVGVEIRQANPRR